MAAKRTKNQDEGAPVGETAAIQDALADRIEQTDQGPVLRVPKTVEEATEAGAAEAAKVAEATGADTPAEEKPEYTRVLAWDGPLNVNDRNKFDPMKPDVASTNPDIAGTVKG